MSSKMQTGRVKKTVKGAQQTFARAVRRQLHVFVLWDTIAATSGTGGGSGALFSGLLSCQPSLSRGLQERELIREESSRLCFASLYRACSYVDVYQPWSKQDYCDIALSWWQRGAVSAYTYLDHRNDLNNIILISLKFQIWKIEYKILLVKFF